MEGAGPSHAAGALSVGGRLPSAEPPESPGLCWEWRVPGGTLAQACCSGGTQGADGARAPRPHRGEGRRRARFRCSAGLGAPTARLQRTRQAPTLMFSAGQTGGPNRTETPGRGSPGRRRTRAAVKKVEREGGSTAGQSPRQSRVGSLDGCLRRLPWAPLPDLGRGFVPGFVLLTTACHINVPFYRQEGTGCLSERPCT